MAQQVKKAKEADSVSILVMRPDNGEILALADVPEYDLNDPFVLPEGENPATEEERQDLLNRMWRNACISDTYEPGSAFKIITASAALEELSLIHIFHVDGSVNPLRDIETINLELIFSDLEILERRIAKVCLLYTSRCV